MSAKIKELQSLSRTFLASLQNVTVDGFLPALNAATRERDVGARNLPVTRSLDRCMEIAGPAARPVVAWLAANRAHLCWRQTYTAEDFGQDFLDKYGWVELIGLRGSLASEDLAAGFLLLGPGVVYPDHHHVAEEVYVPLTGGTAWRKGEGRFAPRDACEVIHHPSNVNHAMRTGDEPLLALYMWRGGPLAQKSVVTG